MSPDCTGIFVAVVGPSGAGKDTLLSRAACELGDCSNIRFARRIITRDADGATEDHDSLDVASFLAARQRGDFCLHWEAHGLFYGLPGSIVSDIASGHVVVANMSRRTLDAAARAFGRIDLVEITARPELLIERLAARGRESPEEIRRRVERQAPMDIPQNTAEFLRIDNSGDVADASRQLAHHLRLRATAVGLAGYDHGPQSA